MKKRILFSVMCAFVAASALAQGQGLAGINEAMSMMTSYFDSVTKLCYAIGAVLGLVGGIKTYSKFSSGDPDTSKTAASWFFACIFLIVAVTILYKPQNEMRCYFKSFCGWITSVNTNQNALITFFSCAL